ncbi:MAG: sigma-70 family RNA polymerase sigma factor [Lachnospiraceae bacterium]|nr:sigma-70 family RNA polymerase sigma factor [Lachnospiraceae bacterium]
MDKDGFLKMALDSEPTLFHVSFSILHNEQDCSDAVQEAMLKAYESRHKLKEIKYFKTWIVRIVINECYSILRKKKRLQTYDDAVQKDNTYLSNYIKEEYIDLYRAIDQLGQKEKICVILYYLEDYSVAETADILKIPIGTVKSRLNHARKELKGLLDE